MTFEQKLKLAIEGIKFDLIDSLVSKLTKEHGRDTGVLVSSILKNLSKPIVKDSQGNYIITIDMAEHGRYINYGTPPHMPPVEALEGWAQRKLGDKKLAWALAYAIKKRGTRPFPFITVTLHQDFPKILKKNLKSVLQKR